MKLQLYQVDAFTDRVFGGNPAAVVPLQRWLPVPVMQDIAAENNLSETAFFVPRGPGEYQLRWFTPTTEVDLCGHATLAAAWVLFHILAEQSEPVRFHTLSGELRVRRNQERLVLDFPARPATPVPADSAVLAALGLPAARAMLQARDLVVVLDSAAQVQALAPDFAALRQMNYFAVCVTAPGDDCDFVSRFFAPAQGIDEDPVTGSAHCTLVPYWAERLGRGTLDARQVSHRGGRLACSLAGNRVEISGEGRCYLRGEIFPA